MSAGSQDWAALLAEAIDDLRQQGPAMWRAQRGLGLLAIVAALLTGLSAGFGGLLYGLAFWFAASIIAVIWHRAFILGESFDHKDRSLPRLGRSYFVGGLIIGAITIPAVLIAVPILLLPFAGGGEVDLTAAPMSVSMLLTLIVNAVIASLCLILPARALDKPMTLSQSWQATAGQRSALVLALSATTMPSIGIGYIARLLHGGDPTAGGLPGLLIGLAATVCLLGTVALEIALITRAYMRLVGQPGGLRVVDEATRR